MARACFKWEELNLTPRPPLVLSSTGQVALDHGMNLSFDWAPWAHSNTSWGNLQFSMSLPPIYWNSSGVHSINCIPSHFCCQPTVPSFWLQYRSPVPVHSELNAAETVNQGSEVIATARVIPIKKGREGKHKQAGLWEREEGCDHCILLVPFLLDDSERMINI